MSRFYEIQHSASDVSPPSASIFNDRYKYLRAQSAQNRRERVTPGIFYISIRLHSGVWAQECLVKT